MFTGACEVFDVYGKPTFKHVGLDFEGLIRVTFNRSKLAQRGPSEHAKPGMRRHGARWILYSKCDGGWVEVTRVIPYNNKDKMLIFSKIEGQMRSKLKASLLVVV